MAKSKLDPNDMGWRPYMVEPGVKREILLEWCDNRDGHRRGPAGGVCWCGKAIPREMKDQP